RRRQGLATDPDRPDDAQVRREQALNVADREQWTEEGYAHTHSRLSERPDVPRSDRLRYREDELDNQDPHGKHAETTLDRPPEELNTSARVGEGLKPGTELRLEQDVRQDREG